MSNSKNNRVSVDLNGDESVVIFGDVIESRGSLRRPMLVVDVEGDRFLVKQGGGSLWTVVRKLGD